ncbi:MAG: RdgB/HAM1 family non-canonical purine NTP pyrophosphatase [Gemmatimonadaceae bacterium]|nr:RdgB/HAM1 family non-canonical purine NTP pyrophosphatase [Gemmatimonadaceae bacterium]
MALDARRIVVATRNERKLRELVALLAPLGAEIVSLATLGIPESSAEDAIESHETFEENALAKARYFHALTGLPTISDDSGLAVDALGGRPGVRSRRWSGRDDLSGRALDAANNALLVEALRGVEERGARFVCAAAYVDDARELVRRGESSGRIVDSARGSGGFGYDPHFLSTELGRTFGEATAEEKGRVSHRARAVDALCAALLDDRARPVDQAGRRG